MSSLANIGHRQQLLLKALLHSSAGLTVDQLAAKLDISRNAVNQHLASLEGQRYVENSLQSSTGGRPGRIYRLTVSGQELFPRHYDFFSRMLLGLVQQKLGNEALRHYMKDLGVQLASKYKERVGSKFSLEEQVHEVNLIMHELGYETQANQVIPAPLELIANNCVFHKLAESCEDVCELDLSLISSLLDTQIEHKECMVRGGQCCRFAILTK